MSVVWAMVASIGIVKMSVLVTIQSSIRLWFCIKLGSQDIGICRDWLGVSVILPIQFSKLNPREEQPLPSR